MKTTVWQEVEVEISLGLKELGQLIAEQWDSMDADGFPLRNKIVNVVTVLTALSNEQVESLDEKLRVRVAQLLKE